MYFTFCSATPKPFLIKYRILLEWFDADRNIIGKNDLCLRALRVYHYLQYQLHLATILPPFIYYTSHVTDNYLQFCTVRSYPTSYS